MFRLLLVVVVVLSIVSINPIQAQEATNLPANKAEAERGTTGIVMPVSQSRLIDHGTTGDARGYGFRNVLGLENLIGPHLGASPDAGAHERGFGHPWHGKRSFTNLLAYGLPKGWSLGSRSDVSNFVDLGANASGSANDFRLFLKRSSPRAFIQVTFEPGQSWNRYSAILAGEFNDSILISKREFRDGLGATLVKRGGNANLIGARLDDEGVLKITGGVASGSLSAVQDDFYTFIRSLWYAWNLQRAVNPPINISFSSPPAYGVTKVGTAVTPSTSNSTKAGTLGGDVTLTAASIIWDISGDQNLNATASLKFRRLGQAAWRDALDLARVYHTRSEVLYNRFAGSIFRLAPGTTYEIKASISDPDGGSRTLQTRLTTRAVPKPGNGRVIEVRPSDNLDSIVSTVKRGDTLLFHRGSYYGGKVWRPLFPKGAGDHILLRAYGDGEVVFDGIDIQYIPKIWIDGIHVRGNYRNQTTLSSDGGINGAEPEVFLSRNLITDSSNWGVIIKNDNWLILDNEIIGTQVVTCGDSGDSSECFKVEGVLLNSAKGRGRGHVIAFNDISKVGDGVSYGGGNIDVHNNKIFNVTDDFIEQDGNLDNHRTWANHTSDAWNKASSPSSFQPIEGGPWYLFRNQFSGAHATFKVRSGGGSKYFANNTFIGTRSVLNGHALYEGANGRGDGVFLNNYWVSRVDSTDSRNQLGYNSANIPPVSDGTVVVHNAYDVPPPPNKSPSIFRWAPTFPESIAQKREYGTILLHTTSGTNRAPEAMNQSVEVPSMNSPRRIKLTGLDLDGNSITFNIASNPPNGKLSGINLSTGDVTYTPNYNYSGNDSFTFRVKDSTMSSKTATISISISGATDQTAPVPPGNLRGAN